MKHLLFIILLIPFSVYAWNGDVVDVTSDYTVSDTEIQANTYFLCDTSSYGNITITLPDLPSDGQVKIKKIDTDGSGSCIVVKNTGNVEGYWEAYRILSGGGTLTLDVIDGNYRLAESYPLPCNTHRTFVFSSGASWEGDANESWRECTVRLSMKDTGGNYNGSIYLPLFDLNDHENDDIDYAGNDYGSGFKVCFILVDKDPSWGNVVSIWTAKDSYEKINRFPVSGYISPYNNSYYVLSQNTQKVCFDRQGGGGYAPSNTGEWFAH